MTDNINRKRKNNSSSTNKLKKQKLDENNVNSSNNDIWNQMVSASSVRNYMLNDPLIDFLKEYNINSITDKPSNIGNSRIILSSASSASSSSSSRLNQYSFTQHILNSGI